MALIVGTNTYATLDTIQAYLTARGYSVEVDEPAVLRAMEYIESMSWVTDQADEDSTLFWGDDPPDAVVAALSQAARLEATTLGILSPDGVQQISRFSVGGAIDVSYESGGIKTYSVIYRLLKGYVYSPTSIGLRLI